MTRLHSFRPALLLLLGLALPIPAPAQTQPAQGFLHAPSRNAPARRTAAPPPPKASPVAPVQQVAPFSSPVVHPPASALGRSAPGHAAPKRAARPASTHHTAPRASRHHKATRPPVVQAPKPAQARKPQGAAATPTPAAPAAVAAAALAAAKPPVPEPSPDRPAVDHSKGTVTGLPLPRWVALRSADVNMRTGPGTRYPVEWQYHRRDLPVKLEREFGVWRLLEDQDGVKGWVHEANLTSRRGFVLVGPQQTLRRDPSDSAGAVALLKPGVVGRIVACKAHAAWCQVRAGGYGGWLKRTAIWGIFPGEAVSN